MGKGSKVTEESRIMISAVKSGAGKTTVTAGILLALKSRGLAVRAFKSGPDFIDPMFHKKALGIPSRNLDPWFSDAEMMRYLYGRGADNKGISVIEGAMGYYDGISFDGDSGSSHTDSDNLKCPVILVLDAGGMAFTAAAVLKGMMGFRQDSRIRGVIFNNVSSGVYERLSEAVERETGLIPLGFLPLLNEIRIKSRHLGLYQPDEVRGLEEKLERLRMEAEKCLDIDGIIRLAGEAEPLDCEEPEGWSEAYGYERLSGQAVIERQAGLPDRDLRKNMFIRIGIALDPAFSFYYEDNLELIRKYGAEIVFFSPLEGTSLPKDIDGVIIGGGYPEIYAKELSANESMLSDIRERLLSGLPCLAECGGFMYLHDYLEGIDGKIYRMTGVFRGERAYRTGKLQRFGYVFLSASEDNPLLYPGESIKGHEFHYYSSTDNGSLMEEIKPSDKTGEKGWKGMKRCFNTFAGFPHLYYYSNPLYIKRFLELCTGNKSSRRAPL